MELDHIEYLGKKYPVRDVRLTDYKVTVKVSTDLLDAAVFDRDKGYTSREGELIDELIFCYVPEELITASNEELEEFIIDKVYGGS